MREGHPWLSRAQLGPKFRVPESPALVPFGEHWYLYSPHSEIALRRLGPSLRFWKRSKEDQPILSTEGFESLFGEWLIEQLRGAWQQKQQSLEVESCFRWIFSEADLLPGLVVDVFGDELVCQIQTPAMRHFWPVLKAALSKVFENVKGRAAAQLHELVPDSPNPLVPSPSAAENPASAIPRRWLAWNGLEWHMRPAGGQKTGAYFDQRDNHRAARDWALRRGLQGGKAWDLCSFEGGFGLHLAKIGMSVTSVDESAEALSALGDNALRNGLSIETKKEDVFSFLRRGFDEKSRVDLIALDPPSFAKSRDALPQALRGLKELNLRAFHCLKPGGLLITCTCSHNVGRGAFYNVLREAAHDARRSVKVLELRGPAPDHAALLGFPESDYLQAWILEVT